MVPGLPERTSDTLVVVGTAPGAPSRLRQFAQEHPGFDVAAVNAGGLFWEGPLKIWASYHYEYIKTFVATRLRANFPMEGIKYVLDVPADGLDAVIMQAPFNGTSSMLATWAGVQMDYPRIVLVGVEMDHHYAVYRQGWMEFLRTPDAKRVRTLSGGWISTVFERP